MQENLEFVQKGVRILLPQLAAYIAREMKREYKNDWWQEVLNTLSDQINDLPYGGEWDVLVDSIDFANCLRLIKRQWNDLFRRNLARDCLTWTDELMSVRNKISHLGAKDMTRDDAERALDTMARLCSEIDFETSEEIRALLRTLRYGSEKGSTSGADNKPDNQPPKTSGEALVLPASSNSALPSWRDVIEPHPDVAQGRYLNAEFAADLSKVARGEGAYEYRDPVEFFARTYVTEGMKGLLIQALRRFSGSNGEPVLQLKTAFGGGKTHSLLALYHMARGGVPLDRVPNLKAVMDEAGISEIPKVKVAVIVGTDIDPSSFRRPTQLPGITVNTVWGEIAAQLAIAANNPSLYDYVKEADKKSVSPGSIALVKLFDECGPCLILMDELVAYAKKLYDTKNDLRAGTFDNFITFIQEITEAASASKNSMVVASIPESEIEIGDKGGPIALEAIEHTFGRKESIWKPVVANEGFEIVRRRLFLDCRKPDQRDMVCAAFSRMYQENEEDFPVDSKELDYMERMRSCYPIHPEIFDRLYEEWATLDNFQRTRGVLRLMAAVIHELWMAGDGGAMIMPGSLPLDVPQVKDELMRYLPGWDSIIDSEVDGKNSTPYSLDKNIPRYAKIMAAQRVSRAIMLGSAPTVRAQRIRGIEASYIRLGIVQPGDSIADYNDALNSLRGKLSYLYSDTDGSRYWYDTHPTLSKTARDRASRIPDPDVRFEIEKRLRSLRREAPFSGIHVCPSGSGDVSDEQTVRLVILKPEDTYDQNDENCQALKTAGEILNSRGAAPRTYRNMIVFLAPDRTHLKNLNAAVREYLAWVSIQTDSEKLDLDSSQKTETANNISRISGTVNDRLRETYCWSIVPSVDISSDVKTVNWDVDHLIGTDTIISRAASKLIQNEQIISSWAPFLLKMELDNLLWKDDDHIQIKKLWEYLTTYCYLPRLANFSVLESTIRNGVSGNESFALASGINSDRYTNLKYNQAVAEIYPSDYLVKEIVALKQINQETKEKEQKDNVSYSDKTQSSGGSAVSDRDTEKETPPIPVVPAKDTQFFMSVKLNNTRVIRDLQKYLDEVINHLSAVDNCEVELSLEVSAKAADGFPQGTVRTVSENCRTLKVDDFGFGK